MPAAGPVMKVPCSTTLTPFSTWIMRSALPKPAGSSPSYPSRASPGTTARSRSAGGSPRPGARSGPRCAPASARPSAPSTGKPAPSSTAGIAPETLSLQRLAQHLGHQRFDRLGDGDEAQVGAGLRWPRRTARRRARRAPCAAGGRSRGSICPAARQACITASAAASSAVAALRPCASISLYMRPGRFRRAQHHRAAAQDARRDRALHRIGRGGEGHARGLHARHQAVLGDRHQRGVQHRGLAGGRAAGR